MILSELKRKNEHIKIYEPVEPEFLQYGRVIGYDFADLIGYMSEKTSIPPEGNIYIPSDEGMEKFSIKEKIEKEVYGEMPIQIGYCNGQNQSLNGLEYHKGWEINIAVTDLILLLGKVQDIRSNQYHSEMVQTFFISKGTAVELYGTTLHFAPCKVHPEGFKNIVILPRGTNEPLEHPKKSKPEEAALFAKNKWLLVHPENEKMVKKGALVGIKGENIRIESL